MSNVQTLIRRCQALGAEFIPTPDSKLKVRARIPLPDALWQELKRRKAEVLAVLLRVPSWPCPECAGVPQLEDVTPSQDGNRTLLWWRCNACQTWGVITEGAARPFVWVTTTIQ